MAILVWYGGFEVMYWCGARNLQISRVKMRTMWDSFGRDCIQFDFLFLFILFSFCFLVFVFSF